VLKTPKRKNFVLKEPEGTGEASIQRKNLPYYMAVTIMWLFIK
jgi:hypothetical protein